MAADAHVAQGEHHHAHHFANAEEEFQASKQGMWVFLVTEVLMFSGLFVAYGIFRGMYTEMFHEAHKLLDVKLGAINTVVLILSSLTMALAVSAVQKGRRDKAIMNLALTIGLAGVFLVIKYFEYAHKFHVGTLPAGFFNWEKVHEHLGKDALTHPKAPLFFSIYFVMTGLHGLHILIGMGLITWVLIRTRRGELGSHFFTPVELVGFYWHFVDLVWIYLFPLLYLVG